MVYTFHIHPDASFHNGRLVTAQDVIFSWERAANPETESDTVLTYLGDIVGVREMRAGQAGSISGLIALDDRTLQVTIDQPKPYFLQKLTYPTTYIVDNENVSLGEEWYRTPNGTGPYRLTRWESMQQKIYERFDEFYGEKPRIRAILVNLYSGDSTRLYETGTIDLTGLSPFDIDRFSDPAEPMHQELYSTPDLCTGYVTLDVTKPPFDNLKVRQAFAQAIDRDLYVQLVLKNGAIPARGLYPPALPGHDLSLQGWEYNPEKAKKLLEEAGMDPGKMPEIIFSSAGYGSNISNADAALIQMWEQNLGVTIHVRNIEPEYYLDNVLEGNSGQISREGWCADYPDPENFADVLYHSGAEMNTGGYSNPEVDALLEQARVEVNTASRIALYQKAEKMIVEDVPAIFLSHSISYSLVKPYIQGYVLAPMVIPFERYLWIDPSKLPNP
jgi:oligopeptide transport system substrate-binding protein